MFAREADEDSTLRTALEAVVLLKIDGEKDEGLVLAEQFRVTGFPTFALMNANGELINRWAGYGNADGFIGSLEAALDDPILITERQARYDESPTVRDADVLAEYHSTRDEYVEAVDLLRDAMRLSEDGHDAYRHRIFTNSAFGFLHGVMGQGDTLFTKHEVMNAADALIGGTDAEIGALMTVAQLMQMVASQSGDTSLMTPYLEAAMERTEGSTEPWVQQAREFLLVDYTLHVTGDAAKALELKRDQMHDGWMDDASELNSFAWWCFENDVNLEEAQTLARRGVELSEPGPPTAMILDTLAEICHARGNTDEALAFMRQAVAEAPEEEHYQRQVARFEEAAAAR